MSDSSSKPAGADGDWRERWVLPIIATFGGLLAIPLGLAQRDATGLLIAVLGGLAFVAGGISLVDRTAAAFVKDEGKRERLKFHARTANISVLVLFGLSVAAFAANRLNTHLGSSLWIHGVVRQESVASGRRGGHTVRLLVNGADYQWKCGWGCGELADMSQLQGRPVVLSVLDDGEILGASSGRLTLVEASGTREGLLTTDGLLLAFGVGGAAASGLQVARRMRSAPAQAHGTVQ